MNKGNKNGSSNPINPFKFGSDIARGSFFADREAEMEKLVDWLAGGERVVIFCARRLGKTALIVNVLDRLEKEGYLTAYLDLSTTPSVSHFVSKYRSIFVKEGSRDWFIDWVKRNLPKLKITLGEAQFDLSGLSEQDLNTAFEKILDLPQQLATKCKKKRAVVALDEFVDVRGLDGSAAENIMRSKFQFQDKVSYIFSGSHAHILEDMFESRGKPFYKSAVMFELQKIPHDVYKEFIIRAFKDTGIRIDDSLAAAILQRTDSNTYYTQQLCHEVWDACKVGRLKNVSETTLELAIDQVTANQSSIYERTWQDLAPSYRKVIIGILGGRKDGAPMSDSNDISASLWSEEFRQKNKLSAGAVDRAIKYLTGNYLIEKKGDSSSRSGVYIIPDPFFVKWLAKRGISQSA